MHKVAPSDRNVESELQQVLAVRLRVFHFQCIDKEDMTAVISINTSEEYGFCRQKHPKASNKDEVERMRVFAALVHKYFAKAVTECNEYFQKTQGPSNTRPVLLDNK